MFKVVIHAPAPLFLSELVQGLAAGLGLSLQVHHNHAAAIAVHVVDGEREICIVAQHPTSYVRPVRIFSIQQADDCEYHVVTRDAVGMSQSVQFWGQGSMFAQAILGFPSRELQAHAMAAVLTMLELSERAAVEQPVPAILNCLARFVPQHAYFARAMYTVNGKSHCLFSSEADVDERSLLQRVLTEASGSQVQVLAVDQVADVIARAVEQCVA